MCGRRGASSPVLDTIPIAPPIHFSGTACQLKWLPSRHVVPTPTRFPVVGFRIRRPTTFPIPETASMMNFCGYRLLTRTGEPHAEVVMGHWCDFCNAQRKV